MKCKLMMVAAAIATLIGAAAETAWAFPPSNPYRPTAADIQGMLNRTGDFSGNAQASTATQSNVPGGIQMDVNWSTGAAFVNETFTRQVRSQRFPDDNGDGDGGDLDAFDGVSWNFLSTTAVAVKPYSQDWDNFNFQEGDRHRPAAGLA